MIKFNHRPSALGSHMECPAKALMEYGLPNKSSVYSLEGDRAHTLLNYVIYNDIEDIDSLLNKTIKYAVYKDNDPLKEIIKVDKFIVYQSLIDSVKFAVSVIHTHATSEIDIKTELVVDNTMIRGEDTNAKCTIDVAFEDEGERTLYIMDYKNGAVPVESYENWQLLSYAKSILDKVDDENIDEIDMRIIQPNISKGPRQSSWAISKDELNKYVEKARERTTKIDNGEEITFNSPSKACNFCRAKNHCLSYNEKRLESYYMLERELKKFKKDNSIPYETIESVWESGNKFNAMVNETEKGITSAVQLKEIVEQANNLNRLIGKLSESLTDEAKESLIANIDRQVVIQAKADFEKLKESMEENLKGLVEIGSKEVGYTLENKEGRLKFIDLEKDPQSPKFKEVLEKHNLTKVSPKTITEIKKEVPPKVWKEELEQFTYKPVSSKLVRKSDTPSRDDVSDLFI